jgi:transcriptional regulator with XRE-family HTH domain
MIADALKKLRTDAGYKQEYLAFRLGISQSHISHLETGLRKPTIEVLEMYATFFERDSITETIIFILT